VHRPLVHVLPPPDWRPLDEALAAIERFRSIVFTSPRAAEAVSKRLAFRPPIPAEVAPVAWGVGDATLARIPSTFPRRRMPPERGGARSPLESPAVSLARAMMRAGAESPVLYPCGAHHREALPQLLREAGHRVHEVVVYRADVADGASAAAALLDATVVVVTSPRVVELVSRAHLRSPETRAALVAIGPTTAAAAIASGWPPAGIAATPSVENVATSVLAVLKDRLDPR
jgi:uroporphyrinogen-III synthase